MVRKSSKRKSKTSIKRKFERNPHGEAFRQKHERRLYESRGSVIPEWLAEAPGKEAEKAREQIRKAWRKEVEDRYISETDW